MNSKGRVLFVTNSLRSNYGGGVINNRNLDLLNSFFPNSVDVYETMKPRKSLVERLLDRLSFRFAISRIDEKNIQELLASDKYSYVFISFSYWGRLSKRIKQKCQNIFVLTFFHNVEYRYYFQQLKKRIFLPNRIMTLLSVLFNERSAVKYSDAIIAISDRDGEIIRNDYKRSVDLVLPTTFSDSFDAFKNKRDSSNAMRKNLKLLFVGSNFFANYNGIKWFAKTVMPVLNHELYIVGNKFEKVAEELNNENVKVIGTVDNLEKWYNECDIVVSPIFEGSGMKTKTAEALMYGKPIIGTKEAFAGYDFDKDSIGGMANTKDEFIERIKYFENNLEQIKLVGETARNVFVTKYDFSSSLSKFKVFYSNVLLNGKI